MTKKSKPSTDLAVDFVNVRDVQRVIDKVNKAFPGTAKKVNIVFTVPGEKRDVFEKVVRWPELVCVDGNEF
jgi:hypothetical protein